MKEAKRPGASPHIIKTLMEYGLDPLKSGEDNLRQLIHHVRLNMDKPFVTQRSIAEHGMMTTRTMKKNSCLGFLRWV